MDAIEYERMRLQYESTPRYFDRQGKPLLLMEWADLLENEPYRVVKQEYVGKYLVSTVWIGLNMAHWIGMPIQIFETMIFLKDEEEKSTDKLHEYQDRYSTEQQALEGHEKAVKIAKGEIVLDEEE